MVRKGAIAALVLAAGLAAGGCGSKKKEADTPQLKGTLSFGVLAPTEHQGELGVRAKDLVDGAQLAVDELNAKGGVLGKKVELDAVDDACDPQVGYEAAKTFLSDGANQTAGVLGGMCDAVAEREVGVVDSTGIPFLVTSATQNGLVSADLQSTFTMNGSVYQQGLSATYWMNYKEAQRLAVVQDDSAESKALAREAVALIEGTPKLVSLQTVEPGGQDMKTIAAAAVAAKPNFILWTGAARPGGELVKALRGAGFKGTFTATAASESPDFLSAAGTAGEGAYVMATSTAANTPMARRWGASFKARYQREPGFDAQQAYDSVRVLAHAIQKAKSAAGPKVVKQITTLDANFVNSLGVVRFAHDHTLLYDNRVILKVKNGAFTWERSLRTDSLG
ncbi:MAG TPA: branched-chain amino acid ABC transporter substrate-binding protein [Solirubrobacter sp.]